MRQLLFLLFFFQISNSNAATVASPSHSCGVDQHWVKAYHRRAYFRADGTPVKEADVEAHCQGDPKSYKFWRNKLRNVRPSNWPDTHAKEKLKNWTEEEIERVLEALNDLPEVLWSETIESISRMDKSIIPGNMGSSTPGHIVLYDGAFDKDHSLGQILAHELAHPYYSKKMSEDARRDYRDLNGWYRIKDKASWKVIGRSFVQPDGPDDPEEDFANNVEFYLFNKAKLRSVTPTAYEWIRNRFGDKFKLDKR